jgi:serine/threonine-protein kinase
MIGTTLSHYKVLEKIGQGGMGEVYRAEDTNLDREVAIKMLPEQFTQDPQRLARFEREAKLLASLNHPNIAAIYGFEKAEGVHFLAMELVPGDTLAERVAKGPLPVEEALEVCRQIAEGVEAAHEKGVIHRDLKPANVKVTPEGKVKILDFGLAKAFEEEVAEADISQSPTLTEEMTRAGVILGTAAYMSPEQAKGKSVDKRADVFAFGAMLYELLTGKRAFVGETITETLGAIIHKEPEWKVLPQDTPTRARALLEDCLEKDADDRLQDIGSVRVQIKKALKEPAPELPVAGVSAVQPPVWKRAIPWSVTAVVIVLAIGMAFWSFTQLASPLTTKFEISPQAARVTFSNPNNVAISPDGRNIVYTATNQGIEQLHLRSLDEFVDKPIPGTDFGINPFFSPDGKWLGFFQGNQLNKVLLTGGSPIPLTDAPGGVQSGSWGVQGTIVFSRGLAGLFRVPATGGESEQLAASNREEQEQEFLVPQILPGGRNVLFSFRTADGGSKIASLSLETGEKKILLEGGQQPNYVKTGHLIYAQPSTGNLMAAPFDLASLEITGDPVLILQGVSQTVFFVDYAVSDNGTLVYLPGSATTTHEHRLVWVDRQGTETVVTAEKRDYRAPRISPDGKQLSLSIGEPSTGNQVWVYDLEAESLSRLTFEEGRNGAAAWSPDSKWLIYQSGNSISTGLVRKPADGSLPQERLTSFPFPQMPVSWSVDGRFLSFNETNGPDTGTPDIGILSLGEEKKPEYIVATTAMECCAKFSPDGKWLAYASDESGRLQVYVRPFPGPDVKRLISEEDEGGGQPVWSPDGKELFYRIDDKTMVVSIQTQDQTVKAGSPRLLFEGSYVSHSRPPGFQYYDISPDGKRFLMLKEETVQDQQSQINVILNWAEELKRLVPTE